MSLKKTNQITKELVQKFCKKHKIDISDVDMKNLNELNLYQKDIDEIKDKSFSYATFLYINFNTIEIDETPYYYKPHKDLYESDEPDTYGCYTYKSQAVLFVPMPIHKLTDSELTKLFNKKEIKMKNLGFAGIPANTIEQLENLYKLFFSNLKSYDNMFNSDTFKEISKSYHQQKEQIKQLNNNLKSFISKNFKIIKKTAELEQDFKG